MEIKIKLVINTKSPFFHTLGLYGKSMEIISYRALFQINQDYNNTNIYYRKSSKSKL